MMSPALQKSLNGNMVIWPRQVEKLLTIAIKVPATMKRMTLLITQKRYGIF